MAAIAQDDIVTGDRVAPPINNSRQYGNSTSNKKNSDAHPGELLSRLSIAEGNEGNLNVTTTNNNKNQKNIFGWLFLESRAELISKKSRKPTPRKDYKGYLISFYC